MLAVSAPRAFNSTVDTPAIFRKRLQRILIESKKSGCMRGKNQKMDNRKHIKCSSLKATESMKRIVADRDHSTSCMLIRYIFSLYGIHRHLHAPDIKATGSSDSYYCRTVNNFQTSTAIGCGPIFMSSY